MSRIGLIGDNSILYVDSLLSIWKEGNCAVLLDRRTPIAAIIKTLRLCAANTCYVDEYLYEKYKKSFEGLHVKVISTQQKKACLLPDEIYEKFVLNYSDDEAAIFFSSGTTGQSKGIVHTYFSINKNADAIISYLSLHNETTMYIMKTLVHSSTLTGELLVALKTRTPVVISSTDLFPSKILHNLLKFNVTLCCLNPTILQLLMKASERIESDFPKLKWIYTSGSIIGKALLKKAAAYFPHANIRNVYGLSEFGPRITAQRVDDDKIDGSVGLPIEDVKICVLDKAGKDQPPMSKGIVHIQTLSQFLYYVSGVPERPTYRDGWHNTGDIGYVDEEGRLFICAREDNMILRSSHNIFPETIEEILMQCGDISECIVYAISDELYGQRILCQYVAESNMNDKLRNICMEQLSPYEIPDYFDRVDELKKNENGKLKRTQNK